MQSPKLDLMEYSKYYSAGQERVVFFLSSTNSEYYPLNL